MKEYVYQYLVKDQDEHFFLTTKDSSYFYFENLEQVELHQRDIWSIVYEYIDGELGVNIITLTGKLNGKSREKYADSLTAMDVIEMASEVDKLSSITLTLRNSQDDDIVRIHRDGRITLGLNSSKTVSPYLDEVVRSIPKIVEANSISADANGLFRYL